MWVSNAYMRMMQSCWFISCIYNIKFTCNHIIAWVSNAYMCMIQSCWSNSVDTCYGYVKREYYSNITCDRKQYSNICNLNIWTARTNCRNFDQIPEILDDFPKFSGNSRTITNMHPRMVTSQVIFCLGSILCLLPAKTMIRL